MTTPAELCNLGEIIKDFNSTIKILIVRLEKKSRCETEIANIDRLKQRISLLKSTIGEHALIQEATPFFLEYKDQVLDRLKYENLILNIDVRAKYLERCHKIKPEDEFAFSLTDSIREHYKKSRVEEKDTVYNDVKKIFNCCVGYTLHHTHSTKQ